MQLNIATVLAALDAASRAYEAARELAGDVAALAGRDDQATLTSRLRALQAENNAGHERLQVTLTQIAKGASL